MELARNFGLWRRISLAVLAVALLWLGWRVARVLGGGETEIDLLINSSFPARITLAFLAAATAPFVEEVIYRGVLYAALERAFGSCLRRTGGLGDVYRGPRCAIQE